MAYKSFCNRYGEAPFWLASFSGMLVGPSLIAWTNLPPAAVFLYAMSAPAAATGGVLAECVTSPLLSVCKVGVSRGSTILQRTQIACAALAFTAVAGWGLHQQITQPARAPAQSAVKAPAPAASAVKPPSHPVRPVHRY
jgi:hypothetical protein